jgi:hypothetical protein
VAGTISVLRRPKALVTICKNAATVIIRRPKATAYFRGGPPLVWTYGMLGAYTYSYLGNQTYDQLFDATLAGLQTYITTENGNILVTEASDSLVQEV